MKKFTMLLILFTAVAGTVGLLAQPGQGTGPGPGPGDSMGPGWGNGHGYGFGQWGRMGPGPGFEMFFGLRGLWRLDLSDEQKEQIHQLIRTSREESQDVMEQLREVRQQLNGIPMDETFDAGVVAALAEQQGLLMSQLTVAGKQLQHDIYMLLTEEQREQLGQMGPGGVRSRWHRRGN